VEGDTQKMLQRPVNNFGDILHIVSVFAPFSAGNFAK